MTSRLSLCLLVVLALSACERPPASAYPPRAGVESLLDVSSEVVSLSAATPASLNDLDAWIRRDAPTRAELLCSSRSINCSDARRFLERNTIPFAHVEAMTEPVVTLVYERVLVRDCNPAYIDNTNNYQNLNHRSFGCALAANAAQHISNKQQVVAPNILDPASAVRGVNDIHRAYKPRPIVNPYSAKESLSSQAKTNN
jgi:hypothetical protein